MTYLGWRFLPFLRVVVLLLLAAGTRYDCSLNIGPVVVTALTAKNNNLGKTTTTTNQDSNIKNGSGMLYRYFCYGSNVLPSTMENLRGIQAVEATAAFLPGYQLRFLGSGGRWEPSSAFVIPMTTTTNKDNNNNNNNENNNKHDSTFACDVGVHGVMYTLSATDFARVGSTEGVPFAYRWKRCTLYPYVGIEGQDTGRIDFEGNKLVGQDAVTLIPASLVKSSVVNPEDVPPSSSYLGIIQEGARYWKLDASYQARLQRIPTAQNLVIPGGLSGPLLQLAEFSAKFRKGASS